jgi:hypothetical protein
MGGIIKKRIEWHQLSGCKIRFFGIVRVQSADHVFYGVSSSNFCWHLGILRWISYEATRLWELAD